MRWPELLRARRDASILTRLLMAPSTSRLAHILVILAAVAALATAKRGCSAFGHSCFGGHGKRSDSGGGEQMPLELPVLETLMFPSGDAFQPVLPPRGEPPVRKPPALSLGRIPLPLRRWFEFTEDRTQRRIPEEQNN